MVNHIHFDAEILNSFSINTIDNIEKNIKEEWLIDWLEVANK